VRTLFKYLALHKGFPLGDVVKMSLRKPDMAIDTRPVVVPTFIERGICADRHHIVTVIVDVFRYVEVERCVAAKVSSKIEAIKEAAASLNTPSNSSEIAALHPLQEHQTFAHTSTCQGRKGMA
jgi:hypothetical protein